MSEPIVFITTMEIHEGKLQEFKEGVKKSMAFLKANGPQLMAEVYVDQENLLAHGVQIHRDSESILSHWQMADTYMRDVMQHITTTRVDIYGQPNNAVMEGDAAAFRGGSYRGRQAPPRRLQPVSGRCVSVVATGSHVGGFCDSQHQCCGKGCPAS